MIRAATLSDVPAITRIYNHAVVHTTATADWVPVEDIVRERWLLERQVQGLPVVVMEIDGEVRGWGSLSLYNPRPGYQTTVENSVYIDPEWHGCGLGSRILAHLIDEARRLGKHAIIASLDGENVASAALHQKFGFVERGRFPELVRKFDRWIDVVQFQLML